MPKSTTENRRAMIAALRSGEYIQGRNSLYDRVPGNEDQFCCIAVGLMAVKDPYMTRCVKLGIGTNSKAAYNVWRAAMKADQQLMTLLVEMNDEFGEDFLAIADKLESLWDLGE